MNSVRRLYMPCLRVLAKTSAAAAHRRTLQYISCTWRPFSSSTPSPQNPESTKEGSAVSSRYPRPPSALFWDKFAAETPGPTLVEFLEKAVQKEVDPILPFKLQIPKDSDVILYEKMTGLKQSREPMLWLAGYYGRRSTAIRVSKLLILTCFLQSNRVELGLRSALGAQATMTNDRESFKSWFSMATLHVWIVYQKLRTISATDGSRSEVKLLLKELVDNFFTDVEYRIVAQGVDNPIVLRKNLRVMGDYYFQALCSYDKALANGSDEVFAEAIWRNIFGGDIRGSGVRRIAIVGALVAYVRRALHLVEKTEPWRVRCAYIDWGSLPDFPEGPPEEVEPVKFETRPADTAARLTTGGSE